MKPNIVLFVFFVCSNIVAQNNYKSISQLTAEIKFFDNINDTHITLFQHNKIDSQKHSIINLSGQLVVGSALAVGFSILPFSLGFAAAWSGNETGAGISSILAISSYLFGAGVGVHWIAKLENPELSFWNTVGYSAIGGGVNALLFTILSTQYTTIPEVGGTIAALCPVIGSMFYASVISDWPKETRETSFYKNILSHKDLIEQTKLFNVELLRIKM